MNSEMVYHREPVGPAGKKYDHYTRNAGSGKGLMEIASSSVARYPILLDLAGQGSIGWEAGDEETPSCQYLQRKYLSPS